MSRTKDELFIICAYETANSFDDLSMELDPYEIGKRSGITAKGVDAISKLLVRSNFIKKTPNGKMILTKNGEALALRLLAEG